MSLVVLPEGLDRTPMRSRGRRLYRLLAERISPIEYELRMIFAAQEDAGPEGMAGAARDAVEVLLKVRDWTRRDEFVARAADLWGRGHPGRTESMARVLKLELSTRASGRRHDRGPHAARASSRRRSRRQSSFARRDRLLAQALGANCGALGWRSCRPGVSHEADRASSWR